MMNFSAASLVSSVPMMATHQQPPSHLHGLTQPEVALPLTGNNNSILYPPSSLALLTPSSYDKSSSDSLVNARASNGVSNKNNMKAFSGSENANSNSSFAAALRNLAKNATHKNSSSSEENAASILASKNAAVSKKAGRLPQFHSQTLNTDSSSLLDVRKGFHKNDSSPQTANNSSPSLNNGLSKSPSTDSSSLNSSSGFQPYRPDSASKLNPNPAPVPVFGSSNMVTHPGYAMAAAAAANYHSALFGAAMPFGLDAEALYRAQLERYAALTGLGARSALTPQAYSGFPSEILPQSVASSGLGASSSVTSTTYASPTSSSCKSSLSSMSPSPSNTSSAASPLATVSTSSPASSGKKSKQSRRKSADEKGKKELEKEKKKSTSTPSQARPTTAAPPNSVAASMPELPPASQTFYNPFLSSALGLHPQAYPPSILTPGTVPQIPPPSTSWDPLLKLKPTPIEESQVKTTLSLSNGEIVLPTKPLDISEVVQKQNNIKKLLEIKPTHKQAAKSEDIKHRKPFVRPFEDDYTKTEEEGSKRKKAKLAAEPLTQPAPENVSIRNLNGNSGLKEVPEEEKATLHYDDNVVKVPINKCLDQGTFAAIVDNNNIEYKLPEDRNDKILSVKSNEKIGVSCSKPSKNKRKCELIKKDLKIASCDNNSNEPITKEKLRYLRYFRLVTHRKRNAPERRKTSRLFDLSDVEIAKLEKRKARYLERSPSPTHSADSNGSDQNLKSSLPLPCKDSASYLSDYLTMGDACNSEMADQFSNHSNSKLGAKDIFMGALGLWKVSEEEKIECEETWNMIMEERLHRKVKNPVMSYFLKLRKIRNVVPKSKGIKRDSVFLSPSILEDRSMKPGAPNTLAAENPNKRLLTNFSPSALSDTKISPRNSPLTKLPINLSTLNPLPYKDMSAESHKSSHMQMPPVSVIQVQQQYQEKQQQQQQQQHHMQQELVKKRIPNIAWPGIEVIVESYRNYIRDCNDEILVLRNRSNELSQDLINKRLNVDTLSNKMAILVRNQRSANHQCQEAQKTMQRFSELLIKCNADI